MPAIERSYDEKRDFIRMQINSPVTISYQGNSHSGLCKDLSGTGMMIETTDSFVIGSELDITIHQKDDTHKPFKAYAEVARVTKGADSKLLLGLTIKEILP